MFKSKVIKIFDFREARVSEELLKIEMDEKDILKQLGDIARKHAVTVEPEDGIKAGDVVIVEMESELEKYNKKNVPISIGAGLFNKSFEEKLLNTRNHEEKIIDIDGKPVKTKVLSIKRKVMPPVTDELIVKENMDGIGSVEEFKAHIYGERLSGLKAQKLGEIAYAVMGEVSERSDILIADEDVKRLFEDEMDRCRALSKSEGLVFEEMTPEQLSMRVAHNSMEAFKESVKNMSIKHLKIALAGMAAAGRKNIVFNEETYEAYIKEKADMYEGIETAKAMEPFFKYVVYRYVDCLRKEISEYYESGFQIIPKAAI